MTEVLDPQMQAMLDAARPREEHQWLQQLVGDWTFEGEAAEPGEPTSKWEGTGRTQAVGDIWVVSEGQGEMPGAGTSYTRTTLGFDPQKGRFVGTWLGTMMPNLWVYDGYLDDAKRSLILESEGPSCSAPGELGKYRDVITIVNEDYHTMTGHMLGDDGAWHAMMTLHFRRRR